MENDSPDTWIGISRSTAYYRARSAIERATTPEQIAAAIRGTVLDRELREYGTGTYFPMTETADGYRTDLYGLVDVENRLTPRGRAVLEALGESEIP